MAAGLGGHQPWYSRTAVPSTQLNRSLERVLEEAVHSGILNLSGRKLKEFPAVNYDLTDTVQADLSKNRFIEIPQEVCLFAPLETLHLYHNCIKCIPETVVNLQMLTFLNISRNLLSTLPKYLFNLPLKVLVVSNNKLVSLPEEIGKLKDLMELDVSCNEIQILPHQMEKLQSLRELNIRRNHLQVLPEELAELPLVKLDFSCNKVTKIPTSFRKLKYLQVIILDNNPMQSPPAQICLKGKVHIFKFLNIQSCRIDKKPDSLDLPSLDKRAHPQALTDSMEDFYPVKNHGPDSGIGSDNGDKRLSTTEPSDDDTVSIHSQLSEIAKDIPLKSDNHLTGNKVNSHKSSVDQEHFDFIENAEEEETPSSETDVHLSAPFVTCIKDQGKLPEKSQLMEENNWEDKPRRSSEMQQIFRDEDELKEVMDLRKIAAQILQQEPQNRRRPVTFKASFNENFIQRRRAAGPGSRLLIHSSLSGRDKKKKPLESNRSTDKIDSPGSLFSCRSTGVSDEVDKQDVNNTDLKYGEVQRPVEWHHEERRHIKQIRKDPMKQLKSSKKNKEEFAYENESDIETTSMPSTSPVQITSSSPSVQVIRSQSFEEEGRFIAFSTPPSAVPFGLKPRSAFTRPSRQEFGAMDPGFTIRRKMEHLREELEQIRQLKQNLELRLKVVLPEDIGAALMDGVVLCHLANHIRPRSVASIHVPSPAVPKLSMAKCRRNVENFLEACRKLGVPEVISSHSVNALLIRSLSSMDLNSVAAFFLALILQSRLTSGVLTTVDPPTDVQIIDPGHLGPLHIHWKPPLSLAGKIICMVRYMLFYCNVDSTNCKHVVTGQLKHTDGFNLNKGIIVKIQTLVKEQCENGSEIHSKWVEKEYWPYKEGHVDSKVKNLQCVVYNMQYMDCLWENGSNVPHDINYRLHYWHHKLDQAMECKTYIKSEGHNIGCHFNEDSLIEFTDFNICINGSSGTRSVRPAYYVFQLQDLVKPAAPYKINMTTSKNGSIYLQWEPPAGKIKPHCLDYEIHSSGKDSIWKSEKKLEESTYTFLHVNVKPKFCVRLRATVNKFCAENSFWSDWSPTHCLQDSSAEKENDSIKFTLLRELILLTSLALITLVLLVSILGCWIRRKRSFAKKKFNVLLTEETKSIKERKCINC
ncbi:leucine-rich repeat and calponin homology domain-containing protein 2-like isoform X3 [Hemitrygon akajei]|uniref:leucine-rich repeat and calponin homology domain-containing protein 2-like isoform X3 n=1 Tax=Hemitrygon akajei TaxID=2704970 RepID=UPI003BF975A5